MTMVKLSAILAFFTTCSLVSALNGRCPSISEWDVCPDDAATCLQDEDCGDMKCCPSSCGNLCSNPVFTGCELLQMEASRRARSLGPEGRSVRVPRCRQDGDFDSIQCDNEIVGSCWCVDDVGFEVAGTRAPARSLVNCTAPAACAAHTCRMYCPHGFELSPDGCPVCRCRDPCKGVRCPGSLSCQAEEVACAKAPCPPVPSCKRARSLERACPVGEPLLISDTKRPFLCGTDPGKPNCPLLYRCLVEAGNDYGLCCPASLQLKKPGICPDYSSSSEEEICDIPCQHDLECPHMQKCCLSSQCGGHCALPTNVTACLQEQMLAELLAVNEREGRGYIPQCSAEDGNYEKRQCSRNDLVCWCVDKEGNKLLGSMGASEKVNCSHFPIPAGRSVGRSLAGTPCDRNLCASVCEYGYKVEEGGCPTCECDDPCEGFTCSHGDECIRVRDGECVNAGGNLCPSYPLCRPKESYENPCLHDAPLTNETTGETVFCGLSVSGHRECPDYHQCTAVPKAEHSVCCPVQELLSAKPGLCPFDVNQLCGQNTSVLCVSDEECKGESKCCLTSNCGSVCAQPLKADLNMDDFDKIPTMCEYLRDFDDKMEGTHDGMKLALHKPVCHENGSYAAEQCEQIGGSRYCFCVDNFGTEIPRSKGLNKSTDDCAWLRASIDCLELTCRLGCDYGFDLNEETRCPACQCRSPCRGVDCGTGFECQVVDVACDGDYCPPVPACLPRKVGQCPYLVPSLAGSCEFECHSDVNCNGSERCCSNGCGTQCVAPVLKTACQHQQAIALHKASESGIPGRHVWVPACRAGDGGFDRVQCHASLGQCWCVDEEGLEVPGTRTMAGEVPECKATSTPCPELKCDIACPHGHAPGQGGCPTCTCRDPCRGVKCDAEDEMCTVVKVECTSEPCPPVAMCLPSPGQPCGGSGEPLLAPGSDIKPLRCGPSAAACPSSHKCQLSPLAGVLGAEEASVCCPKPRSVCFEPKDEGACINSDAGVPNATRWFFNPEKNKCEKFTYGGCSGNHNNFQTEQICNAVCPVLSPCERLREKNQKAALRYRKQTFAPACDPDTGKWMNRQCMQHIGVCWCVNSHGEPLKGSLVRGPEPSCNFRQARKWDLSTEDTTSPDRVLEELIKQMTAYNFIDSMEDTDEPENREMDEDETTFAVAEKVDEKADIIEEVVEKRILTVTSRCLSMKELLKGSELTVSCDADGKFTPMQCDHNKCWCVDEAGNQLPGTSTFSKADKECVPTPIVAIEVKLGFLGVHPSLAAERMKKFILEHLDSMNAVVKNGSLQIIQEPQITYIHFTVVGGNKVDIVYNLEQLVKENQISFTSENNHSYKMTADITRSYFQYKLGVPEKRTIDEEKTIAMQHREIVSESTVSLVTPYHTAIIVLVAASAFTISAMSILIMLYKKKVSSLGEATIDKSSLNERFLAFNTPIYVLSTNEKQDIIQAVKFNEDPQPPKE